jgi:PAS domain S-box-containing protein
MEGLYMEAEHKPKILMVDDKQENLFALEIILANENYTCVKANSGREALKILMEQQDFALILMDVQMPTMDGFETAELIRQSERLTSVPIIFLTANINAPEDIFKGYKTGAVDYMIKPLSADILKAKVAIFTDLYRKTQELIQQGESMKALNVKLKQQSEYVRSLIEAGLDPMLIIDLDGKITDMNVAFENVTGMKRDQIAGSNLTDYFTKTQLAGDAYKEVFEKGSISDYSLTLNGKDGKQVEILLNGSVYKDDKGKVLGAVLTAREKLLSKYSLSLIEASLDPLITINAEGKITGMNQALVDITGISREKITGSDFLDYFTEPEKAREVYEEAFKKGYVMNFPLTVRHKNGKLTDVLFNGSIYKDERGNVLGIVIVARDVTEMKKFEKELIEAKSKAEVAMRSKQQFLANMSHEIRTPMNAIIGFTKVLLRTDMSEKQKEYINAIKLSGDALIVLINDILDLAKVDAGKMTFEQAPFNLRNSISAMLHLFEAKVQEKHIELKKEIDPKIPQVLLGDSVRLHQIVMNLISNAIKFTHKGGITLNIKLLNETNDKTSIEFIVKDTGIGIPEAKLDAIFENFQQASSATSRIYGGTGLGLAIVKQLVEAQGGTVSVQSKVGEGSSFRFTLDFGKTNEKLETDNEKSSEPKSVDANIKILVVEDIKLNQLLMKTLLEDQGFIFELAENGKIAVEKLKTDPYDLVLMDLQMPEMNGFEATKHIREKLKLNVPIIALTADVTSADVENCKKIGMNDYISKPVDDKLLYRKIMKYVKRGSALSSNGHGKNGKPAPETKPGLKYVNFDYLKELTSNDKEGLASLIQAYLDETPKLIDKIKQGIENKDWKSVAMASHSIIPSFEMLGIEGGYDKMSREIQELAEKNGDPQRIKELFSKIERICELAITELRQELPALKTH